MGWAGREEMVKSMKASSLLFSSFSCISELRLRESTDWPEGRKFGLEVVQDQLEKDQFLQMVLVKAGQARKFFLTFLSLEDISTTCVYTISAGCGSQPQLCS